MVSLCPAALMVSTHPRMRQASRWSAIEQPATYRYTHFAPRRRQIRWSSPPIPRRSAKEDQPCPKVLRCGDLMPECNAVIEGRDEAEVMAKGAEHAKTAHKMDTSHPMLRPRRRRLSKTSSQLCGRTHQPASRPSRRSRCLVGRCGGGPCRRLLLHQPALGPRRGRGPVTRVAPRRARVARPRRAIAVSPTRVLASRLRRQEDAVAFPLSRPLRSAPLFEIPARCALPCRRGGDAG